MKTARALTASLILILPAVTPCLAQFRDDFEDGNLSADPEWNGDLELFRIEDRSGGRWLRSYGRIESDTLILRTSSKQSFGTWKFDYRYSEGAPTNFNHARIILSESPPSPSGTRGHLLQLGANDGSLRLYAFSGDSSRRTLLASSAPEVFAADSLEAEISVERTYDGRWTVYVDRLPVLDHEGAADFSAESDRFGVWIKHTASRGNSHWFDDIEVGPGIASDSVGPLIVRAVASSRFDVGVTFDEPVLAASACVPDAYVFLPREDIAGSVTCPEAFVVDSITVRSGAALQDGSLLRAEGLTDPTGNVSTEVTVPVNTEGLLYLAEPGDLAINEIDFAPSPPEAEYVELLNRSTHSIDVSQLVVADDRLSSAVTAERMLMPPGTFLVLTRDSAAFASRFPGVPAVEPPDWPVLNNGGDLVAVISRSDTVDAVRYDGSWNLTGAALERVDPGAPADYPGNWGNSVDGLGGTPGKTNSIFLPDTLPPRLASASRKPGERAFVSVRFTEPVPVDTLRPVQFELNGLPADRMLKPVEKYSDTVILEFSRADAGDVVARYIADASANVTAETRTRLRLQPAPESIVINEILFDPVADPFDGRADQPEFLELRSLSGEPMVLGDCVLAGPTREDGTRDFFTFETEDAEAAPHGFVLIVARDDNEPLVDTFPDLPGEANVITVRDPSLRLQNDGTTVSLECPDAGTVDVVSYLPDWHDDTIPSHRGLSLERIDPFAPSHLPTNWSTSRAPDGATPGRPNSIMPPSTSDAASPTDIIISEVMFEPRMEGPLPQFEYLELQNTADGPRDINGFFVTIDKEPSDSAGVRIAYAPTVLGSGQYALIANGPSSDDEADDRAVIDRAFPSFADADASAVLLRKRKLSLPNRGGDIALHDRDGQVIDEVHYSPKWHHPHLVESRGISLERISRHVSGTHPSNWTSSVHVEGGTPGRENSVSAQDAAPTRSLSVSPSPFFPDRDGDRDHAIIRYSLASERPMVRLTIFDSRGRPVRHLSRGTISGRSGSIIWDGFDDRGVAVRPGIYIVYLQSIDVAAHATEELQEVVVVAWASG